MSADLVFVYVNHLDDDTLFLTDYYKLYNNRTAIIIKRDAIFVTEEIAHAIGHVLGAGHGHDKSKTHSTIFLYLLICEIREHSHMTSDILGVFLTYLPTLIRYFTV